MKVITKNINGTKKNVDELTSKLDRLDAAIAKMVRKKGLRFDSATPKTTIMDAASKTTSVKSDAQDVLRNATTASAPEKKLTPEQVDYVVTKITADELFKASEAFAKEFKKRHIGSGKVISVEDALKIAALSFRAGFMYSDGKDLEKIMK